MKDNRILCEDIRHLGSLPVWEKVSGKTLLITGATGMLGSYLALAANEANQKGGYGSKLLLMGRDSKKVKQLYDNIECQILLQDVREPLNIDEPIHYIMHTAGPVGPAVFENDPAEVISVNIEGTLSLLRYAVRHDCQSFAFASTHEIYGRVEGEQTESSMSGVIDTTNPRSSYILAKQTAENLLACFSKQYGLKTVSARFSRLYGPLMNLNSGLFVCDFLNDVLHSRPVHIRGELNLLRPLCYISDAAEAMLQILVSANARRAYNVQGDELSTIGDVAKKIALLGNSEVKCDKLETEQFPIRGHWLNTDKLKSLKWQQRIKLTDGLIRTYDYFRDSETKHE